MEIDDFEQQLGGMLAAVAVGIEENQVSVADVRKWIPEYLKDVAEEAERFPEIQNEPHWNLCARDACGEDAVFVIMASSSDHIGVVVGRGERSAVHGFHPAFHGDFKKLVKVTRNCFPQSSDVLTLPLAQMHDWTGFTST